MAKGQAQVESSIHTLFSKNKFPADIDYDNVIQRPALLASRLLDSPQSLHYFYTTFFGKNTVVFRDAWGPKAPDSNQEAPQSYGSDKGVNELFSRDKTKVREQLHALSKKIRFGLHDLNGASGQTDPEETQPGILGVKSIIWLGAGLYHAAQDETRMLMDEDKAYMDLFIAATLLHEVAHAAHFSIMGRREEDYFEDSLIAEAGYELESHIFGMVPEIDINDPFDSTWQSWQHLELRGRGYDLRQLGRKQLSIAKKKSSHSLDCNFVLKLVGDEFWTGGYAQRGGVALIPDTIIEICRKGGSGKAYKAIPNSVKELWMESKGINYAHKRWSSVANKDYEIRKKAVWVSPW
jgi:hypothetical protein